LYIYIYTQVSVRDITLECLQITPTQFRGSTFPGNMHNYIWCPYYLPSFRMGNFAMAIWNSTCNPCFSTFDQFLFVFHGLKTGFFCYSLKLNFICYPNRFFTYDYSLWDGGRHTFVRVKTNFNFDIKSSFVCSFCPSIFD
jgi:hypothetical protein